MSTFNYPIISASFTEAATTPDGGGLPAQVKVVAGVDTSTGLVHVLKTDSSGQLFTTSEPNVLPSMGYVDFASTPLTTTPYNILLNGSTVGTKIVWYSTSSTVFILNRPGGSIMYISTGSSGYIPMYIGASEQLTINTFSGTISVGAFYLVVIP